MDKPGKVSPRFGQDSVLLQDQVLQLVRRAEQEGGGLPVSCDELPHRRDLWRAELSRSSAAAASLTVTVGAGGGGIRADCLHTQICGTWGHRGGGLRKRGKLQREQETVSGSIITPRTLLIMIKVGGLVGGKLQSYQRGA